MMQRLYDMAKTGRKTVCLAFILSATLLAGCISDNCNGGDAGAEAEVENIVKTISSWLEPYKGKLDINVKREGSTLNRTKASWISM